jgi:hypothetical protein
MSFTVLERKHQNLVAESTQALQRQKGEISRLGAQVQTLIAQNKRLCLCLALLVDSLDEADQESLLEEPALVEAHGVWMRWRARLERVAEGEGA